MTGEKKKGKKTMLGPISQERARLYLDTLNAIPEPTIVKDSDGKFVFANQYVADLYQTTCEEMIGKDDAYFTGDEDQALVFRESVQKVIASMQIETVYDVTTDINTGQKCTFESLKVPFTNSDGELNVAIYARNVSNMSELKDQAEKNVDRLKYVLDVSGEGMWDWVGETGDVNHNKQWEVITGVVKPDNSFSEFQNCILEEDRSRVTQAIQDMMEKNLPYDIEYRMVRANDGEQIWVWDRGRVVERNNDGHPTRAIGLIQDVTEKKTNQAKIESMAFYDLLTKLPNRALLQDRIHQAIEHCKRFENLGAILFLDLDYFKLLNDAYGHQAGDELLVDVANRIQSVIRADDTVARFGGDEFVIVLGELGNDKLRAAMKAESIAKAVRKVISTPVELKFQEGMLEYSITVSIGITVFDEHTTDIDSLLRLSDVALYSAKGGGRDNSVFFDPDMQQKLDSSIQLEKELRHSISQQDFVLHYQPQYDINHSLIAAEALIRWNHPELGMVNPAEFIAIAEDSNLIVPIGAWVLAEACAQLAKWQNEPHLAHLTLSINVSAKQIWQKNFVKETIDIITRSGANQSKLKLELTESVLLKDINDTANKLKKLREFGLYFSLDDFGTGFSSLSYLKNLPIDEIKIDKSFIRDIMEDESDLVMVKTIISLGDNLGIKVVAEGVETKPQFDLLKSFNCNIYQGFYFSRPLPYDRFIALDRLN